MTSSTSEGIRERDDESTWREVVMENFEYYYDLKEVYSDRTAYRPKATSAGITATGYAPSVAVSSSKTNADTADDKEDTNKDVQWDIQPNLDGDGVYNTPTDRL